ncbi:MAG: alpha/beta hydrolase [Solirubrobacterales bacterium]|nr:alpha/beta hydrolase [Solirubrobacterales bacterium]
MNPPAPRRPDREGSHEGLAYALWLPAGEGDLASAAPEPPWPAVLILHGAGSCKENHADFARLAARSGWAALSFDARGHGDSDGEMSPAAVADVIRMARLLAGVEGVDPKRVAVRGSSMGGFLAIHAAAVSEQIGGVIAICPAGEQHLRSGLREERLDMRVDADALFAWLGEHDLRDAVERLDGRPLILLHAEGDDQIPCDWSIELYERALDPRKLVLIPGGDHRSIQHDAELQAVALRWMQRQLEPSGERLWL